MSKVDWPMGYYEHDKKYGVFVEGIEGLRAIQSIRDKIIYEGGFKVPGTYEISGELANKAAVEDIEKNPNLKELSWHNADLQLSNGRPKYVDIKGTFTFPGRFYEKAEVVGNMIIEPELSIIVGRFLNHGSDAIPELLEYSRNEELIPIKDKRKELADAFRQQGAEDVYALKAAIDALASIQSAIDSKQFFNAKTLRKYYNQVLEAIKLYEVDEKGHRTDIELSLAAYKANFYR